MIKHFKNKKSFNKFFIVCMSSLLALSCAGCEANTNKYAKGDFEAQVPEQVSTIDAFTAGIYLNIDGTRTASNEPTKSISISSETSINTVISSEDILTIHSETFSKARSGDGVIKESLESYIAEDNGHYYKYFYNNETDDWSRTEFSKKDASLVDFNTGMVVDWSTFFAPLTQAGNSVEIDGKRFNVFTGTVDSTIFEELMPIEIFNDLFEQIDPLLKDNILCNFYVDEETFLPYKIELDFKNCFIPTDMKFDRAIMTIEYSYNVIDVITIPKKISVTAEDEELDFYSNFYAWDVFKTFDELITAESLTSTGVIGEDTVTNLKVAWDTGSLSINNSLYLMPVSIKELISSGMKEIITGEVTTVEPGHTYDNYVLQSGGSKLSLKLKNNGAAAQAFSDCSVISFDYNIENVTDSSLDVIFPGGITLGSTLDSILSVYGEPTKLVDNFSSASYYWQNTEGKELRIDIDTAKETVERIILTFA